MRGKVPGGGIIHLYAVCWFSAVLPPFINWFCFVLLCYFDVD